MAGHSGRMPWRPRCAPESDRDKFRPRRTTRLRVAGDWRQSGKRCNARPAAFTFASPSTLQGGANVKVGGRTVLSSPSRAAPSFSNPQILRKTQK